MNAETPNTQTFRELLDLCYKLDAHGNHTYDKECNHDWRAFQRVSREPSSQYFYIELMHCQECGGTMHGIR